MFFSFLLILRCAVVPLLISITSKKLQSTNKIAFNGKTRIKGHIWKCILCSQSKNLLLGTIQKPLNTGHHHFFEWSFLSLSMRKNNKSVKNITLCRHSKVIRFYDNCTDFLIIFSEILALERCNCTIGIFVAFNSIIYYRQFQVISTIYISPSFIVFVSIF